VFSFAPPCRDSQHDDVRSAISIEHLGQDLSGMRPVAKDVRSFTKVGSFYDVWEYALVHCYFNDNK